MLLLIESAYGREKEKERPKGLSFLPFGKRECFTWNSNGLFVPRETSQNKEKGEEGFFERGAVL
ncbi:hypothetical protein HMPREF0262_00341 [Clostridium sp. ATCC 29733]|nr:hypothetical protein HMPREF0262_00341 [Clostridium sp. ATCC 29733]